MAEPTGSEQSTEAVRALFVRAAATLSAADVPDDALARLESAHRRLGIPRPARLRSLGRVWRLGVLLLQSDGTVHATGAVTRAVPPGHPGHVAASVEARREMRAAAFRGPFRPGETVHFDAPAIDLAALEGADGPLFTRDGRPLVRWSVSAGDDSARDLEAYLAERVDLLVHPVQGAS